MIKIWSIFLCFNVIFSRIVFSYELNHSKNLSVTDILETWIENSAVCASRGSKLNLLQEVRFYHFTVSKVVDTPIEIR